MTSPLPHLRPSSSSHSSATTTLPPNAPRSHSSPSADPILDPGGYEDTHVHQVYDSIASHFSSTRYKPWPIVEKFLQGQKLGAVGVDVGCGNGKYFGLNGGVVMVGSDRSHELVRIAARHHHHTHQGHQKEYIQQHSGGFRQRKPQQEQNLSSTLLRRGFTRDQPAGGDEAENPGYDVQGEDRRCEVSWNEADQQHQHQHGTQDIERSGSRESSRSRSRSEQKPPGELGFGVHCDRTKDVSVDCDGVVRGTQLAHRPLVLKDGGSQSGQPVKVKQKWEDERQNQYHKPLPSLAPSTTTPDLTSILPTASPIRQLASNPIPESLPKPGCKCVSTALIAAALALPHPSRTFDFAICIAVIHHLATRERRVEGIREILRTLRRGASGRSGDESSEVRQIGYGERAGQALIFVWALEQSSSRRGWGVGDEQDQLVPWVLRAEPTTEADSEGKGNRGRGGKKKHRQPQPQQSGGAESASEADSRGQDQRQSQKQVSLVGEVQVERVDQDDAYEKNDPEERLQGKDPKDQSKEKPEHGQTYHRFYHLYRSNELNSECAEAGGAVVDGGYERDNWWVIVEPS